MSDGLTFRPLADGEEPALIALWQRCGLVRPSNDPARDIAFARGKPASDILVARLGDRLAASVMVGHDGHRGMVYYVGVDPGLRGRGYGGQTMRAAERWLADRGVWKLNLLVRADNEAVRGFYEALGYEVEPRLCMARKLIAK